MNTRKWFNIHISKIFLVFFISILLMISCSYSEEKDVKQSVVSFAQNYFNLRYKQAISACTPESEKWVCFKATNITQEDIDIYNAYENSAECRIESIELNDDKATVIVEVHQFLCCDSIGKPSYICPKAKTQINLIKIGEKWLVDLQSPLTTYI